MEGSYRRSYARRRAQPDRGADRNTIRAMVRLIICASIFLAAVLMKIMFPSAFAGFSEKLTTAVDYNSALTVLGEGLGGERKFTTALGEAFAYAFTGVSEVEPESDVPADVTEPIIEENVPTFGGDNDIGAETAEENAVEDEADAAPDADASLDADAAPAENELANAIISAFMQTQEGFSDYALPAGVTYEMPVLGIAYVSPVEGDITSRFGYREHPDGGGVKFHYGVDIKAEEGTPILSFSDGEVVAVGESATMGKYVLMKHKGVETKYAHCSEITVSSGQTVAKGDEIAKVGMTGNATAPCLHFELLNEGVWINPEYYLNSYETV